MLAGFVVKSCKIGGRHMRVLEHYQADILRFFDTKPAELGLYETLFAWMEREFPDASVKVQKTQVSFYGRHLFAAASLPVRRKKDWPKQCILVSFGLGTRLKSSRIAVATEPYPGRWTHHVVVSDAEKIDGELMEWLRRAWEFAEAKR